MKRRPYVILAALLIVLASAGFVIGADPDDKDSDHEIVIAVLSGDPAATGGDSGSGAAMGQGSMDMGHGGMHTGMGCPCGHDHWKAAMAKYLNLSADQIAKFKDLKNSYYVETRDLRYDLAMRHLEMRKLFTDPGTTEATLLAKHKELSTIRQKLMDRKAQLMFKGRSILTPEQIQKLDRIPVMAMRKHMMGSCSCGH